MFLNISIKVLKKRIFIIFQKRKIKDDFLTKIKSDQNFKKLSSDEKIEIYIKNGAIIEKGVRIGIESVIVSNYIHLKENSVIGEDTYIQTLSFELGVMSVIGNKMNVVTRHIKIGDVFFSGNSITIGGGGAFSNNAKLIIGDECLVSSHCILNTGEGIIIGNRVGLSPHVKLYTHNHWQNELEGYNSNFGPIIIDDNAYITGDSIIVPNVKIGKGSTVFANSTVTKNIQPYTQVCGNPAVVIGKINTKLDNKKKNIIIKKILENMYNDKQLINIERNNVTYYEWLDQKSDISTRCFDCP
jgi:Acetyltransferase (isoleucine patch superfamily)